MQKSKSLYSHELVKTCIHMCMLESIIYIYTHTYRYIKTILDIVGNGDKTEVEYTFEDFSWSQLKHGKLTPHKSSQDLLLLTRLKILCVRGNITRVYH